MSGGYQPTPSATPKGEPPNQGSGEMRPRPSGFRFWIEKATAPVRALNRSDYRALDTDQILRRLAAAEHAKLVADTTYDLDQATFALQELRAVLQERK